LIAQSAGDQSGAGDAAFLQGVDEKWRQLIESGDQLLADKKSTAAVSVLRRALSQAPKVKGADDAARDRMVAIANKKLGQAYTQSGDYLKADGCLKDAKAACGKLAIADPELDQSVNELAKYYKSIEFSSLGERVLSYLKEAGVNKISVFRKEDRDLVEVSLDQKYVKPVESKDVPKVSFNKKVSFEFLNRPNGDYQVSKIQGLQVMAKSLWVNLLDSLLKAGATPVAEITAGKLGMTKTVTMDVPAEIYNSTKEILDNLVSAIKGQPAYAATGAGNAAPIDTGATETAGGATGTAGAGSGSTGGEGESAGTTGSGNSNSPDAETSQPTDNSGSAPPTPEVENSNSDTPPPPSPVPQE
jgi:hypothetical protein